MRKDEFIGLIKKRLPEQSEVHNRTIELSVSSLFNDIIFKRFKKGELDQFALPYENIEVQKSGDKFYCDLPVKLIPSPTVFGNVRRIYPSDEDDTFFIMIHPNRVRLIKHDDLFKAVPVIPYYLKGTNKVFFPVKNMSGITHVDMNIIPPITAYDWEDEIMMPAGSEYNIVKEVASLFMNTPPKDKVND